MCELTEEQWAVLAAAAADADCDMSAEATGEAFWRRILAGVLPLYDEMAHEYLLRSRESARAEVRALLLERDGWVQS